MSKFTPLGLHALVTLISVYYNGINAFAIIGESTPLRAKDYPNICMIITTTPSRESFFSNDEVNESVCSGTLITPTRVLTAAHCFGKNFNISESNIKVECGNETRHGESVKLPAPHLWPDNEKPKSNIDYAIIDLSYEIVLKTTSSLQIAKDSSLFFDQDITLKSEVSCSVFGFGTGPSGNIGYLRTASLDSLKFLIYKNHSSATNKMEPETIYAWNSGEPLPVSTDRGDSGGPLFCTLPGSIPTLVGVITGYQFNHDTKLRVIDYFTPIWNVPL